MQGQQLATRKEEEDKRKDIIGSCERENTEYNNSIDVIVFLHTNIHKMTLRTITILIVLCSCRIPHTHTHTHNKYTHITWEQ